MGERSPEKYTMFYNIRTGKLHDKCIGDMNEKEICAGPPVLSNWQNLLNNFPPCYQPLWWDRQFAWEEAV